MLKSEYAREQIVRYLSGRDAVNLDNLVGRAQVLTDDGDPRWIGAALNQFAAAGLVRFPACGSGHNHGSGCTVELVDAGPVSS